VVRTTAAEYECRQPKSSQQAILPANTAIQFTLDKDKMKFQWKAKYEFLVVGSSALHSQRSFCDRGLTGGLLTKNDHSTPVQYQLACNTTVPG